MFGVM
jgi:hypothetical protein